MKMLSGLRLKLLLLSGVPLACLIAVGSVAIIKFSEVDKLINVIAKRNVPQLTTAYELEEDLTSVLRQTNGVFMTWDLPEKRGRFLTEAYKSLKDVEDGFDKLSKIEMSPEVKTLYTKASESNKVFHDDFEKILSQIESSHFTPAERDQYMNAVIAGEASRAKGQLIQDVDAVVTKIKSLIEVRAASSLEAAQQTKAVIYLGLACALIVSCALLIVFFRIIFSTLGFIQKSLFDASTQVQLASEHLASASQQLSESSNESAASLEESVASMQELSSMVQLNAESSKHASELTLVSRRDADRGSQDMGVLAERMNQIRQSSAKMEQIISAIDDIAFQTNLLALNAAVEAARAGDQGKGFAVVADAVRALAHKSAASAKEISELIQQSSAQVSNGVEVTERSQKVFGDFVASIRKISELNDDVAKASQEQASGVAQVSQGMNNLDAGVQSNAATAEEIAASSEELSAQVNSLRGTVDKLNELIDGHAASNDVNVVELSRHRSQSVRAA